MSSTSAQDSPAPTVFVSYAWESDAHERWVEAALAARLRRDGCDVRLDRWESAPGDPLTVFMEGAIRESRHVLVVCTPGYKTKMDSRDGGVGYEGNIITGELLGGRPLPRKFIPVLRAGDPTGAMPSWLLGRYYVDLRDDPGTSRYERNYAVLLATLHGDGPAAPPIGRRPTAARPATARPAAGDASPEWPPGAIPGVGAASDTPHPPPAAPNASASRWGSRVVFGRDVELQRLRGAVDAVAAAPRGGGGALVLRGVSGAGKTTLVECALEYAASLGLRVVRASCEAFHEGMSFYPVLECLRQVTSVDGIASDIATAFGDSSSQIAIALMAESSRVDPSARRDALIATFANQLFSRAEIGGAPIVVFVDDLERIDTGSADALLCLLTRLREGGVLVIGAYRNDIVPASGASTHPLRPVLSAVRRADTPAEFIDIDLLPEDKIAGLVAALLQGPCDIPPSFLRRLFEETEGNPLYVREALRTLASSRTDTDAAPLRQVDGRWRLVRQADSWEIPRSVDDAIASRLVSLAESDRAVLEVASVVGRQFHFDTLLELGVVEESALMDCIERQLRAELLRELPDSDSTLAFTHGRIRDVLYHGMSSLRRGRLHGQIADVLVRRRDLARGDQFNVAVGNHLFAARRYPAAIPYLLEAGQRALDIHAAQDAAHHLRRALEALERAPEGQRSAIDRTRYMLGVALKAANEFVAAETQLLLVVNDGADPHSRRWALNYLGDVSLIQGRVHEALARYADCEQLAHDAGDHELLAETAADLAELHMRQAELFAGPDPDRSAHHAALYDRYLKIDQELSLGLSNRGARARAYRNAAKRQRTLGNIREAIGLYETALSYVDPGVNSHQFLIPYAKALRLVERHADALAIVGRVLDWSRQIGARRSEGIARQYMGLILMELALAEGPQALDAAQQELQHALALHQEVGFEQGRRETEVDLAELHSHRGDRAAAVAHLRRALAEAEEVADSDIARSALAQMRANGESARAERLRARLTALGIL